VLAGIDERPAIEVRPLIEKGDDVAIFRDYVDRGVIGVACHDSADEVGMILDHLTVCGLIKVVLFESVFPLPVQPPSTYTATDHQQHRPNASCFSLTAY
jgi:hypothetical protein